MEIILRYAGRIEAQLREMETTTAVLRAKWFSRFADYPAESFEEALQRILFVNQLMWQTNHRLVGLGHWDALLGGFYEKGLQNRTLTLEDAFSLLCSALRILHIDYKFKSNLVLGDTGQIIVVGASNQNGDYVGTGLTDLIISAVKELAQPDPKVLLRVNKKMPDDLWETALDCMASGCGSPLLSNDDVIIPHLVSFGVTPEDACSYITSACWEPLIAGKDSSLNNVTSLNFMKGLNNVFQRDNLQKINSYEELKARYRLFLAHNITAVKRVVSQQRFQYDPVLSLFMKGCSESGKDVAHGGAVYHDIGITTVGLSNVVNALLNLKEHVFERHTYTLEEVQSILNDNFENHEPLRKQLSSREIAYGVDDSEVIDLTNELIRFVSEQTSDFRTYLGGRLKFGLSAPAYIDAARDFPASFDGRKMDEPFAVHISNEKISAYTTIINFVAALDLGGNRFNGNVIDLMATPNFIHDNKEKLIALLRIATDIGFFQMQMNVFNSKTLIEAKKRPSDFPNLIVRVWGFSAYMIDLPEEYKDVLIMRALENERSGRV
ncbi:pyruvate formate lyase family protein [Desulfitobacterium hafniense]|uniref:pyruvate formate lyase family protein n=1 Tax=Desulfitobacterium hafniense TaxID=49338 RepID=UPI001A999375|nr:pyruvate formate lyase family protein [Desulfitobacterium hafniense]